ncbi:hypothetical protein [Agromyces bauzanensis]|uniref:MFS transporter n=1 Tax=Agromyces bauzanensis TaxID=1308924 RepID=A0A917UU07_9MICO|nr:hypothetical protein [Agromyces bauzanensis]GGJ85844.1 hypothetical protein GCM10011372_25220 [Agromyces bauzanensis]
MLLVAFVAYERRRMRRDGSALLPMPLFADRGFSAGIVTQAAFQGALNAFTLPFIIYLQAALGFGLNLLAFSLGALVGTGAVIPLVPRIGKYLVTAGSALLAAGVLWVFAILGDDWSREHVLEALQASVPVSVAGLAIAAVASLLLPNRHQVQAHLDEARRLAELDAEADAASAATAAPVG